MLRQAGWQLQFTYVSEPIACPYGIFFISSFSGSVIDDWSLDNFRFGSKGVVEILASCRLNQHRILSIYVLWEIDRVLFFISLSILRFNSQCISLRSFILKILSRSFLIPNIIASSDAVIVKSSTATAIIA